MAVLWEQLPAESRTARVQAPSLEWGTAEYLLWQIEFQLRNLIWSLTSDSKHPTPKPTPIQTPGQMAEAHRKRDNALAAKEEIDALLGMEVENG